jgi:hypothetical protein
MKEKGQLDNDLQNTWQKIRSSNTNPTKNGVNLGASERLAVPAPNVTPIVLL